jgi:imidazolonepropionase
VAEALAGITCHAAKALALEKSYGQLHIGQVANFVVWPCKSAAELVYHFGHRPHCTVIRQGKIAQNYLAIQAQDSSSRHHIKDTLE